MCGSSYVCPPMQSVAEGGMVFSFLFFLLLHEEALDVVLYKKREAG